MNICQFNEKNGLLCHDQEIFLVRRSQVYPKNRLTDMT